MTLAVTKTVYYCEFCKRHRMTRKSIEAHEPRCIYNPNRSVCGWHDDKKPVGHAGELAKLLETNLDVDELREGADDCPACMLSAVVQAKQAGMDREDIEFDYATEVERFRKDEREDAMRDEMYEIEKGWL